MQHNRVNYYHTKRQISLSLSLFLKCVLCNHDGEYFVAQVSGRKRYY